MNKKIIIATIAIVLIGGGIGIGVASHNSAVAAATHAKIVKTEKDNLSKAKAAVALAYQSGKTADISAANKAITKLDSSQRKDQSDLQTKMSKLKGFLSQISSVNSALAKVTKSKNARDIANVQNLIAKETDSYLVNDKKAAQAKLDTLKKQIADAAAKAKAVQAAKVAAEKAKAQADAQAKAEQQATAQASQRVSNAAAENAATTGNASSQGDSSSVYQAPATPTQQAPAAQVSAQQAPAQANQTPAAQVPQADQQAPSNSTSTPGYMGGAGTTAGTAGDDSGSW